MPTPAAAPIAGALTICPTLLARGVKKWAGCLQSPPVVSLRALP